jgi:7,8-dihydropterin-6-yl-methyl-4-(beta-D-ribofuranosyl)aminobenzene 5'-phosphate synthase
MDLSKPELQERFDLQTYREPYQISKKLFFLGEIPRINEFESQTTPYVLEGGAEDFVIDDSGLACITDKGLVVVSGCAHSGICNMIEHAINVTGVSEIRAVLGGFHLSRIDYRTGATIDYLKRRNVKQVLPSHCTMEPALSAFYKTFGRNVVMVGQEIVFDS